MAYSLTVAGYTFQNPPDEYRKLARLSNTAQTAFDRNASDFYQSDSQDIQFQVEGTLALDPPLGETEDDLDELERLQQIAIEGGEVAVQFDPFFSGTCVIEDDPFRQSAGESTYEFTFSVNSESTDATSYPARSPPSTGNTFELGSLDIGYDPDSVSQNYERETAKVKRLQGIARSVDNAGLVPTVNVSGKIDGEGQATLWEKARDNVLAYLTAEFQNGWCLVDTLSIRNDPEAPDYLDGLFQYDLDVMIVKNPASGIGDVTSYVDQEVKESGTYAGDTDSGSSSFDDLQFTVGGGSGSLDGDYIEWNQTTVSLSDNDTNFVYVDDADSDGYGTVKVNQSTFPADALELYRVEVSGGVITKVVDVRAILIEDQESVEGGNGGGETIEGDIYLTISGGDYEMNDGVVSSWNDTRLLLQPNTTNYIWAEDPEADGTATVETNTSGYPSSSDFVKLYRAETDADSITNLIDDRPSDISDGKTDTSDADLSFQDDLALGDAGFAFERLVTLSDSLALATDPSFPWLGLADFADALAVAEGPLDARGITSLTDVVGLSDGGTASGAGSEFSETVSYGTAADWDGAASESGVVHDTLQHTADDQIRLGYPAFDRGGSNLMLYLPMHSGANDESGNSNDGSSSGVTYTTPGMFGTNAGHFDGNDHIRVPDDPSLDVGAGSFTMSVWVVHDAVEGGSRDFIVNKAAGGRRMHLENRDGRWRFEIDDGSSLERVDSTTTPQVGTLYHLVIRRTDTDVLSIHVNATEEGTNDMGSYGDISNGSSLYVGSFDGTQFYFRGWMDELRWWDRALSDAEIQALYDAGTGGSLTTPSRTFSQDATDFTLKNVVASLNSESITVTMESDPDDDGSFEEASDPISLDGSGGPYDITGLNSPTKAVRLKVDPSTTDETTSPVFDAADIQAGSDTGGDADQNPETSWEIIGARYDSSGNEYEGGGMVSTYGG